MGHVAGVNEPCVFHHPVTGHILTLFVDDILSRGSREVSEAFYDKLASKFEVKDPNYLEMGGTVSTTLVNVVL